MASDQQFCLRWNNHQNTLVSIFDSLLESGTLVDCTLAAEGRFLQAHKVVLSACSPYFAMLLREHYDKFPILILKDIKYLELQAMMNYMYRGEVNITQETLGSFLKAAESLQIRGLTDNSNCVENNNGVVRDNTTHPYHMKKIPDSRKIVVPTTPLLSQQQQQRSRSPPAMLSQTKKYLKSPGIIENHQISNSKSSEPLETNSSSTKRRKLLPPIKSEGLVVTPINPAACTYNNVDVNNTCEVPSQPQSVPAIEGKANVPSPSVPPKVESPHMDITPVLPNKVSSSSGNVAGMSEQLLKPKQLAELVKVKSEQLDDSYNEDTNDDSYTTEDNCENDRDENSQLGGTMPFPNSQSGQNFEGLDRSLVSQDGSLQESSAFAFNQYWLNNWEYNSKYVRLTETNPFSCQHCGKRYRWKSTLKRHESFECGGKEPAHKCPHCDYRAKQSGNLRVHIRKYHTDRSSLGGSVGSTPSSLPVVNDLLPAASSDVEKPEESMEQCEPKIDLKSADMATLLSNSANESTFKEVATDDQILDEQSFLGHTACYSDSADSDQSKHFSKKRFSPFQVETLKRVFAQSPYITQSQAAAIARRTGLKKLQVRKWFSDYRCKIKKQSILLERFSSAHAAEAAATVNAALASGGCDDDDDDDACEGFGDDNQTETIDEELDEDAKDDEEETNAAGTDAEADADEDTDVDMNAEIEEMIAARSVRPITVVFGKRSRKRGKKRDVDLSLVTAKRAKKSERAAAAAAAAAESHTVKRFSPFQVEMLKKAYADSPYITQRQAAVIARNIGLKKMQVRKWFCDHRCKIKKQSLRMQADIHAEDACDKKSANISKKGLLERFANNEQTSKMCVVDVKEEDDEHIDFTDSDEPHATNGVLDDTKDDHLVSKSRISLPRRTFRFNEKQLKVLNEEFEKSQFLTDDKLSFLCDQLQERRERIQTWFKMRRYKLRQSEQKFWQNIIDSS